MAMVHRKNPQDVLDPMNFIWKKYSIPDSLFRKLDYPKHLVPYYNDFINAYKNRQFRLFERLWKMDRRVDFFARILARFLWQLRVKPKEARIKIFLSIYCLISNECALPNLYKGVQSKGRNSAPFCYAKLQFDFPSFCFVNNAIAIDVLSEICDSSDIVRRKTILQVLLSKLCSNLNCIPKVTKETLFTHSCGIAACIAVGIETLPNCMLYTALIRFFEHMLSTVSENTLFSHCTSKTWDDFMLFCEHWVNYSLNYPFLKSLNPLYSKEGFKNCVEPNLSIFYNSYVRNKLRYEFVHVKGVYVPCEYPVNLVLPRTPQDEPNFKQKLLDDGYCEECKKNIKQCFCIQTYLDPEIMTDLTSDSAMEIDGAGNNSSDSVAPLWFDSFDSTDKKIYDSYEDYNISYSFEKPNTRRRSDELKFHNLKRKKANINNFQFILKSRKT